MKLNQFKYRQGTGIATVFTAESAEEEVILDVLQSLIEGEKGALSRKCFTFDIETNSMSIDMEKYNENSRRFKPKKADDTTGATESTTTRRGRTAKSDK